MCGIFGYVTWNGILPPHEHLCRATNLLRHRGPDGGAFFAEGPAFLGHRRLAIIDLRPCGRQPMFSASGRYVITFNGEIYNYVELRAALRTRGHTFRTNTDTEVILAGYEQWGDGVASHLLGMFAFGLYDRREKTISLVRDRFGEKPLLVWASSNGVAFASEMAPLTVLPEMPREIDLAALGGYLSLNYVPGDATLLAGVRRVPPATWMRFGARGLEASERYWTLPQPASIANSLDEAADAFQERLDRSIAIGLRSDVPVGLFLSGGVDSSLVAESAARQGKLSTAYCVDMQDSGFSEWAGASRVASRLGLQLERVPFSASVLDHFIEIARHADDPLADSSAVAVWTVAQTASRSLKVVLSGDGGDELFGGYLTYAASAWHARMSPWLPSIAARGLAALARLLPASDRRKVSTSEKLQRFLRAFTLPTGEAHFTWNGIWLPDEAATLVTTDRAREAARLSLQHLSRRHGLVSKLSIGAWQRADLAEYLPNDILTKVDRMTMAHGLESRAPLLDPAIAELSLGLPDRYRIGRWGRTKVLLRHVCARHFGAAHANAPKQGFSIPIHRWLRGPARDLAISLLAPDRVAATGVLDPEAVTGVLDAHLERRRALGWEIWGLMVLVAWYEARVAKPPTPDRLPVSNDLEPLEAPEAAAR